MHNSTYTFPRGAHASEIVEYPKQRETVPSSAPSSHNIRSPPIVAQLQPPQPRKDNSSPSKTNIVAHITSILAHLRRNRPNIPDLRHGQNRTHPANDESDKSSKTNRQLAVIIPSIPIPPQTAPFTEDQVFFQDDGDPDRDPVAHEREEVCEDLGQVGAARDGADGEDDDSQAVPDHARDFLEFRSEDLEVDEDAENEADSSDSNAPAQPTVILTPAGGLPNQEFGGRVTRSMARVQRAHAAPLTRGQAYPYITIAESQQAQLRWALYGSEPDSEDED